MTKNSAKVFDRNWEDYENWFERHKSIYSSELKALKKVIPEVAFVGGLAKNPGIVKGLEKALDIKIKLPEEP